MCNLELHQNKGCFAWVKLVKLSQPQPIHLNSWWFSYWPYPSTSTPDGFPIYCTHPPQLLMDFLLTVPIHLNSSWFSYWPYPSPQLLIVFLLTVPIHLNSWWFSYLLYPSTSTPDGFPIDRTHPPQLLMVFLFIVPIHSTPDGFPIDRTHPPQLLMVFLLTVPIHRNSWWFSYLLSIGKPSGVEVDGFGFLWCSSSLCMGGFIFGVCFVNISSWFWCFEEALLRDCGISWVSSLAELQNWIQVFDMRYYQKHLVLHLQNSRIESRSSICATTRNISYLDHFIKEEGCNQIRDAIGFDYDFLMVQKLGRYSHISRSPELVISFLGSTFEVTRRQVRNIKDGKTTPRAWPVLDSQARKGKLKTDVNYIKKKYAT